ncbi:MAG: preprotein translocase subunit SecE [Flavobacteriales bacterium]|nr:preprotein translocase subunit SecE [Flavobacteriales bacterium]|tara:strand:+ start:83 stop:337 length:255 start_codon:yes stop_codon:yes gene_type:complete
MRIGTYIKDAFDELLHKVTWPTWEELQNSAVVVAIASLIISLIIFFMDFIFGINVGSTLADGTTDSPLWRGILGYFYQFIEIFK